MPRQSEETSESHTLPPAELNPLINPLLAENMGRWAEVYFTSPPENREQAVLDLLRELESEKTRREVALASELAAQPPLVRCETCAYDNPATNKFCGMCGAPMSPEGIRPSERSNEPGFPGNNQHSALKFESEDWNDLPKSHEEPPTTRHELSLFQAYRETDASDASEDWSYEPAPSTSYRGYIGAILAILILGLGYMAWRGMQNSKASSEVSPPPPAVTQQASTPTQAAPPLATTPQAAPQTQAAAPPTKSEMPDTTAAAKTSTDTSTPASPAAASPEPASKTPPRAAQTQAEPAEPPLTTAKAEPASAQVPPPQLASDKWGAEELAVAQRYLGGTSGQRRDTAEAAKWLWKSIAKHNGEATLLLADLYLKGDGVPKNCDQARVLLDSAARKGISGAGERLRNLQAFGCQ